MNLISAFLETARVNGNRTALVSGAGEKVSYSALARRSGYLAESWRRAGVRSGLRVLVAMPVGIDLYAAIAGLWRLGATIVFPEPAMGLGGLKHALGLSRPRAFLCTGVYRLLRVTTPGIWKIPLHLGVDSGTGSADPIADLEPEHPALISFTSGSTGKPKGIVRSHGFLAAQNACVGQFLAPEREDETDLVAFPVFAIANLGQGVTSVLPNWKLSRHDRASAKKVAGLVAERSVTRALIPPSICEVIARSEVGLTLDAIFTGGGPVFPSLLRSLMSRLPGTRLVSVYGSTEAEPIAHQCAQEITTRQWRDMTSGKGLLAGRPIPQTALRIIDDEIVVTGEHVNKSYLDGHDDAGNKLRIDGEIWHRTGDAGRVDDDGFLWLRGRRSAVAAGLYPFELEVAARSWPGVRQAAVVPGSNPPVMAVAGDEPMAGDWQKRAEVLGEIRLLKVRQVPMDRRHRSKVDYSRLKSMTSR